MAPEDQGQTAAALACVLLESVRGRDDLLPDPSPLRRGRTVTTGIGLSGGPARVFASEAARLGGSARFASLTELSAFPAHRPDLLVVFSQGLSPNARLADRAEAERTVVLTGVSPSDSTDAALSLRRLLGPEGDHIPVPADEAPGPHPRLQSPVTALYAALRWLARAFPAAPWATELESVPTAYARALERPVALHPKKILPPKPTVFVCAGRDPTELHQLAWKWCEALSVPPPLIVDALEWAHGPLQGLYESEALCVGFRGPGQAEIFERLEAVLDRDRHSLCLMDAELPPPLDLFEFEAGLNALMFGALRMAMGGPQRGWKDGQDAPLYNYGA